MHANNPFLKRKTREIFINYIENLVYYGFTHKKCKIEIVLKRYK